MHVQFNSDNQTDGDTDLAERVEGIARGRLSRIERHLTRMEIHVGDAKGPREGASDKRCAVEVRPAGMAPITASDQAGTIEEAVAGAAEKVLAAYDREIGKRTTRKGH